MHSLHFGTVGKILLVAQQPKDFAEGVRIGSSVRSTATAADNKTSAAEQTKTTAAADETAKQQNESESEKSVEKPKEPEVPMPAGPKTRSIDKLIYCCF